MYPATKFLALAMLIAVSGLISGCSNKPGNPKDNAGPAPAKGPITLSAVTPTEFDAELAKHQGKVVLVDFWATWCGPCKEKFPHTIALYRKHADAGLVVITASVDEPTQQAEVLAFLNKQQADTVNVLATAPGKDPFEVYGIEGSAIPFIKLYDRKGVARHTFGAKSPPFKETDIDAAVVELLKESS